MNIQGGSFPNVLREAFQQVHPGSKTILLQVGFQCNFTQTDQEKEMDTWDSNDSLKMWKTDRLKMPESRDQRIFSSLPLKVFVDDID